MPQQPHQERQLTRRPLPVFNRKTVERQLLEPQPASLLDHRAHALDAFAVANQRGSPLRCAQRPFPSMMTATCRGSCSGLRPQASIRSNPSGEIAIDLLYPIMIVWRRSGPTDTIASGTPTLLTEELDISSRRFGQVRPRGHFRDVAGEARKRLVNRPALLEVVSELGSSVIRLPSHS